MSGVYDEPYVDFLSSIIYGGVDIRKVIKSKNFVELGNLNLRRWQGKVPHNDLMNGLLMATRFNNEPKLYTCYPLGAIEEGNCTSIGSGSNYALEYISGSGKLIPKGINLGEGIDLTVGAIDQASQDLYTGGLDLIVIKEDSIHDLGKDIREAVNKARSEAISRAIESIRQREELSDYIIATE